MKKLMVVFTIGNAGLGFTWGRAVFCGERGGRPDRVSVAATDLGDGPL